MTNLKWKFDIEVTGLDEATCDRILNWMSLVVGGYGGTISGGFSPEEKPEELKEGKEGIDGEEINEQEDSGSVPDG